MFVQRCLGSPELRLGKEQNVFKNRKKIKKKYVEKYKKNKNKQTNKCCYFFMETQDQGQAKSFSSTRLIFPSLSILSIFVVSTSKPTRNRLNSKFIACMYI